MSCQLSVINPNSYRDQFIVFRKTLSVAPNLLWTIVYGLLTFTSFAQTTYTLKGTITDISTGSPISAQILIEEFQKGVVTDEKGNFSIEAIPANTFRLKVSSLGYISFQQKIRLNRTAEVMQLALEPTDLRLEEVVISQQKNNEDFSIIRLKAIDGSAIYAGKKTEVILPELIAANKATNNARQIFAKVPGLNIWESDGAGLQMGIGGRGLSPNRNSNFNVRQNGYDISADALGYPESYYTPPVEALERIEVVRGAASLQYGTQFGGLVNFVLKKGNENTPFEITTRQTVGSWWLYNNFTSIGGATDKVNYYGFYQYKRGNGWRPNSGFENHTAFATFNFKISKKVKIGVEYTHLNYLAQQGGGLTDAQFEQDPRQSFRERNWFKVNWNLMAVTLDYKINDRSKINVRNFGLYSGREALGILERINEIDRGQNRDLISDTYLNFGNETRFIHRYNLFKQSHTVLTGVRVYKGLTERAQGFADNDSMPNFRFLNPERPGKSDYTFPGFNFSWFAENVFNITKNFTLTPGIRSEYIYTAADGNYNIRLADFAGNIITDTLIPEQRKSARGLVLLGIGASYKPLVFVETYANFSQNYRSITFSDLRIENPNFRVDPNIQDERGFNADLGVRGSYKRLINYDISTFLLAYNNRIGQIFKNDTVTPFLPYRYRTNIGKSITIGLESFLESDLLQVFGVNSDKYALNVFLNCAIIRSTYTQSEDVAIEGNQVELVPPVLIRTGISFGLQNLKLSLQYSYVKEHFTDATNAIRTSTAVNGIIPSYYVMDFSAQYLIKRFQFEAGINNFTNNKYFTRRADAYPGPGIIPSDALNFYVAVQYKFSLKKKV
jgi:Fe(3+) dicitrate transport protein